MEKGILTKASQAAILLLVQDWVKDQKPWLRLTVVIGLRAAFIVADDKYADKLPEALKEKAQRFFDAILIDKDIEVAIMLGVELIPDVIDLFKKPAEG